MSDLTYFKVCGFFTLFVPNTPEGSEAWEQIAKETNGTGKVHHEHVSDTLRQLRAAGYSASERKTAASMDLSMDDIYKQLGVGL